MKTSTKDISLQYKKSSTKTKKDPESVRIGNRIRTIRSEKNITQTKLGELTGLTADRIRKYENGFRKPQESNLYNISKVLGVNPEALMNPDLCSEEGAVRALFEIANKCDLQIVSDMKNGVPNISLVARGGTPLYSHLKEWCNVYNKTVLALEKAGVADKGKIIESYHNWQWNYPESLYDDDFSSVDEESIDFKIAKLQKEIEKLKEQI